MSRTLTTRRSKSDARTRRVIHRRTSGASSRGQQRGRGRRAVQGRPTCFVGTYRLAGKARMFRDLGSTPRIRQTAPPVPPARESFANVQRKQRVDRRHETWDLSVGGRATDRRSQRGKTARQPLKRHRVRRIAVRRTRQSLVPLAGRRSNRDVGPFGSPPNRRLSTKPTLPPKHRLGEERTSPEHSDIPGIPGFQALSPVIPGRLLKSRTGRARGSVTTRRRRQLRRFAVPGPSRDGPQRRHNPNQEDR